MRPVKRGGGTPAVLSEANRAGPQELARARDYWAGRRDAENRGVAFDGKAVAFEAYADDAVKYALEQLFHGKCAYCESHYRGQAPVDVEHYRPKGRVADEKGNTVDHPGYWWKAMAWDNLLPSCIDCNRRRWQRLPEAPQGLADYLAPVLKNGVALMGKMDMFPVAGTRAQGEADQLALEKPLLLDPTVDEPEKHLEYYFDRYEPIGLVLPRKQDNGQPSIQGMTSIHIYGLNRLGLVQDRTRLQRRLVFLAWLIDDIEAVTQTLRRDGNAKAADKLGLLTGRIQAEIAGMAAEDQPYCSMVKAWIKRFGQD